MNNPRLQICSKKNLIPVDKMRFKTKNSNLALMISYIDDSFLVDDLKTSQPWEIINKA
ncbi:hypothetical protein D3C72_1551630 [compost metagenome]